MKITPIKSLYESSPVKSAVEWAVKDSNLSKLKANIPAIQGVWIAGFYVTNTLKSKDIPEERKTPLAINTIFTTACGTIGGYTISKPINKFIDALYNRFNLAVTENKDKKTLIKGMKSIVPLVSFALAYRYLAPVLATPAAAKINKYLIAHNIIKDPDKAHKQE